MIRRCRIEHRMMLRNFSTTVLVKPGATDALMELYTLALSNALAGYTYRSVEEMTCRKKSEKLSESEKEELISSMYEECGSDLAGSGYNVLRSQDEVDSRLLFCLALRWDNRHLKYLLAEDPVQRVWWETVLSQNMTLSENCVERVFKSIGLLAKEQTLSENNLEATRESAEQDLLIGYIVRLHESLDPL